MSNVLSKVQVNGTDYDLGLPILGTGEGGYHLGIPRANHDDFVRLMKMDPIFGEGYGIKIDSSVLVNDASGGLTLKNGGPTAKEISWNTGGSSSHNMNEFTTPGVYEIYGERVNHSDNLPINNVGGYTANGYGGHSFYGKLTVLSSALRKDDGSNPTEISVTQILMLSNRKGGDGNIYYRSYNQNNSPFEDGWSVWKKLIGTEEGYIFTDTWKMNQDGGLQTRNVGLNYMVDNGTYSGVYVNSEAIQIDYDKPWNEEVGNGTGKFTTNINDIKFIETFNITTINDYAVTGQVNKMLIDMGLGSFQKERQICQVKVATDLISGTSSIKKRVYKGNDADYGNSTRWSDWEEIGTGGGETVVDMEPLLDTLSNVLSQGTSTLVVAGLPEVYAYAIDQVQPNTIYELNIGSGRILSNDMPRMDNTNKVLTHFNSKWQKDSRANCCKIRIKYIDDFGIGFGSRSDSCWKIDITGTLMGNYAPIHYTYYVDKTGNNATVSADPVTL